MRAGHPGYSREHRGRQGNALHTRWWVCGGKPCGLSRNRGKLRKIVVPYPNTVTAQTLDKGTATVFIKNSMVAKEDCS